MITAYEVCETQTLLNAKRDNFSPHCIRSFSDMELAKKYAREFAANSGRATNLIVCAVTYTPIFETVCTISTSEKDL